MPPAALCDMLSFTKTMLLVLVAQNLAGEFVSQGSKAQMHAELVDKLSNTLFDRALKNFAGFGETMLATVGHLGSPSRKNPRMHLPFPYRNGDMHFKPLPGEVRVKSEAGQEMRDLADADGERDDGSYLRMEKQLFGEDLGARDPTAAELATNFGETISRYGEADTMHKIAVPREARFITGPLSWEVSADHTQPLRWKEIRRYTNKMYEWYPCVEMDGDFVPITSLLVLQYGKNQKWNKGSIKLRRDFEVKGEAYIKRLEERLKDMAQQRGYIWTSFSHISQAQRENEAKAAAHREWRYVQTLSTEQDDDEDDDEDDAEGGKVKLEDLERKALERMHKYPESRIARMELQTGSGVSKNDLMFAAWINEVPIRDLVPEDIAGYIDDYGNW